MEYFNNPIVDAFLLAGYHLPQLELGFRSCPEALIEKIEILQTLAPCKKCNVIPEHGWISHASINHCEGLDVQFDLLKKYRLSCGSACLICNLTYANADERLRHIRIHFDQRLLSQRTIPLPNFHGSAKETITEYAIKLKSYTHFNFYKQRNFRLFVLIPTWLQGDTIREKLLNIDRPTYIPVSTSRDYQGLFTPELLKQYDIYSTTLYAPALDEKFDGVRQYNRMYGKLMIRLLATIKQQPASMNNIRFLLYKEANQPVFDMKNLVHVTDEDIKEVVQDVLTNKPTVICWQDLFETGGCRNAFCMSFVHCTSNFKLVNSATDRLNEYKSLKRHDESRFGLGKLELLKNPSADLWMPFAEEIIRKKNMEIEMRTPCFVYVVLCMQPVNSTEMPTFQNVANFCDADSRNYNVYVGYSYRGGIPNHHYLLVKSNETENDFGIAEDQEESTSRGTELSKHISRGEKALFIFRNYLEDSYEAAVKLEAVIQLYYKLSDQLTNAACPVQIINKRIETSALSYISLTELDVILRLIELRMPLFYDSPEALDVELRKRNLTEINWGIIKKPFFMSELQRLPL